QSCIETIDKWSVPCDAANSNPRSPFSVPKVPLFKFGFLVRSLTLHLGPDSIPHRVLVRVRVQISDPYLGQVCVLDWVPHLGPCLGLTLASNHRSGPVP
uniref:Uncharacterized protein n=1 Tax=Cannabis sativa TaxID=3483 RepID=A0A803QDH9_CANSA